MGGVVGRVVGGAGEGRGGGGGGGMGGGGCGGGGAAVNEKNKLRYLRVGGANKLQLKAN